MSTATLHLILAASIACAGIVAAGELKIDASEAFKCRGSFSDRELAIDVSAARKKSHTQEELVDRGWFYLYLSSRYHICLSGGPDEPDPHKQRMKAFIYLEIAATDGNRRAQSLLADWYVDGRDYGKNPFRAYTWSIIVSANEGAESEVRCKMLEKLLSRKEQVEATRLSFHLLNEMMVRNMFQGSPIWR